MNCYIGLDIGTSAVKGAVLAFDGTVLATASGAYHYTDKGTARLMDPTHFLDTCLNTIKQLAEQVETTHHVAAICPSCASGNLLFLDKDMQPLIPFIGWQTHIEQADLDSFYTDEEAAEIYKTVGWPRTNGFAVAMMPWFCKYRPDLLEKTAMICMSAEYLNFSLCGAWGLSHSMATPFYFEDQEKGIYNQKMLDRFGVTEAQLPPLMEKGSVIGSVKDELCEKLHLPQGTAVVLGSFDHPSGATGAGVYECGEVLLSCGTSWVEFFPMKNREEAIDTGFLVDRFMLNGSPYCVMKSVASLGMKIDLLRKHYFGDMSHREFDNLIAQSEAGCGGLTFDFTEADYGKADGCEPRHIARAIIECAARLLKDNFALAAEKGLHLDSVRMIGGITNSDICMQVIADVLERPITVVNGVNAGAVGAAMLAAIGVGDFADEKHAFRHMQPTVTVYS